MDLPCLARLGWISKNWPNWVLFSLDMADFALFGFSWPTMEMEVLDGKPTKSARQIGYSKFLSHDG